MATQLEIRTSLAERVLESIKAGTPSWRSVHNRGLPTNPQTGKKFTGINPLVLDAVADKYNYRSKYWATYHQWHLLGMQVPKRPAKIPSGNWGVHIVNWNPFIKTVDKGDILSMERFHLLSPICVFNADQCFGKEMGKYLILKKPAKPDYSEAARVVEATKANVHHDESVVLPLYERMPNDRILMPYPEQFTELSQYWATLFHELAHYSEVRIGWNKPVDQGELMAEIVMGYMESELGLPHDKDMTNHEKWVDVWIENIEKNPVYLFEAAAYAARSVDWILGFSRNQILTEAKL